MSVMGYSTPCAHTIAEIPAIAATTNNNNARFFIVPLPVSKRNEPAISCSGPPARGYESSDYCPAVAQRPPDSACRRPRSRHRHRGSWKATLADVAGQTNVSAKYLTTIWKTLETKEDVGPLVKLQAMWRALPVPRADQPELARDGSNRMREFVTRMRKDTSLTFASPIVKGLSNATQPLMNWKNRAYATHRRDFDRAALRVEGEPPPVAPVLPVGRDGKVVKLGLVGTGPNGEDLTALKAQVEAYTSRMGNPELVIPARPTR